MMAIVVNKSRPAVTNVRNVQYDHTNEPDVHLSTANTDKLALFQFNLAQRTADDRGNPETGVEYDAEGENSVGLVTHNSGLPSNQVTHNGEDVSYA